MPGFRLAFSYVSFLLFSLVEAAGAAAAPSPSSATQLLLGLHEAGLDPGAHGAVLAHEVAVEELRQRALDALVDVPELLLARRHLLQQRLVQHRLQRAPVEPRVHAHAHAHIHVRERRRGCCSGRPPVISWAGGE